MPSQNEIVDVDCVLLHETTNAYKVRVDDGDGTKDKPGRILWVPKSVSQIDDKAQTGKPTEIAVERWFAEKEGLV